MTDNELFIVFIFAIVGIGYLHGAFTVTREIAYYAHIGRYGSSAKATVIIKEKLTKLGRIQFTFYAQPLVETQVWQDILPRTYKRVEVGQEIDVHYFAWNPSNARITLAPHEHTIIRSYLRVFIPVSIVFPPLAVTFIIFLIGNFIDICRRCKKSVS